MVLQENPSITNDAKGGNRLRVVELFASRWISTCLEGWDGKSALSGYRLPLRDRGEGGYDVVWSTNTTSTKRQHANEVYEARWPEAHHCGDDIGTVPSEDIPDHDLLVGGFPCQDYSVATTLKNSKGLRGKKGVLWWQIERILREKGDSAPRYLFLENVDRLLKSPSSQRADFGHHAGEFERLRVRRRVACRKRSGLRNASTPSSHLFHGVQKRHPGI